MKDEAFYTHPRQMEPLLPSPKRNELAEITSDLPQSLAELRGRITSPIVLEKIADLVRKMNCYYSNLIEGQQITPSDIEKALQKKFSKDSKARAIQQLSLAHINIETHLDSRIRGLTSKEIHSKEFLCSLHKDFYQELDEDLLVSYSQSGKPYKIVPGQLRDHIVEVGEHLPPHYVKLDSFLTKFSDFYANEKILETNRLIAIACAHQRLAWIHPFADGNGRVARLHSQALFKHYGFDANGLFSISRGLAFEKENYYSYLARADQERYNDYDGRDNLSEKELGNFCIFFLNCVGDQIKRMSDYLNLFVLHDRVEKFFAYEMGHLDYREELMKVYRTLVDEGEIARHRVEEITGKKTTISSEIIQIGLNEELLSSPSPKGKLQVNFPLKVLGELFPKLYPTQ